MLKDEIQSNPKLVAIGEIGLDFHYGRENEKEQDRIVSNSIVTGL